ncbi:MAG: hypothetical protein ACRCU6_09095 [Fusobacteriaceae bacterium]
MEFNEIVKELEKRFGEKATVMRYVEGWFEERLYNSDTDRPSATVKVAGYNVELLGERIIRNNMQKTNYGQVLKYEGGHYGFSHRAGQSFKIGDRLFDENWIITKDHEDYGKYLKQAIDAKNEEPQLYQDPAEEYVTEFVPFTERGNKVIETEEEELQSALNFGKYVS